MFYLITDQENKTWGDVQWGENISHEQENDNYHFVVFNSPETARYLYPSCEGTKNPKIWNASGENMSRNDGFRTRFAKLTTISELAFSLPTNEQRINFGILCALNVMLYEPFKTWALKYLRGEDQTKESAQAMNDEILAKIDSSDPKEDYSDSCFAVLASVMLDEPAIFSANAAHRAYHDSLECIQPLNLEQIAEIVNMMSAKDIAELLS